MFSKSKYFFHKPRKLFLAVTVKNNFNMHMSFITKKVMLQNLHTLAKIFSGLLVLIIIMFLLFMLRRLAVHL